jgi:hypothetical protein
MKCLLLRALTLPVQAPIVERWDGWLAPEGSLTRSANAYRPARLQIPLIRPLSLNIYPGGSGPRRTVHTCGGRSPSTVSCDEYSVALNPFGSTVVAANGPKTRIRNGRATVIPSKFLARARNAQAPPGARGIPYNRPVLSNTIPGGKLPEAGSYANSANSPGPATRF